jgi:short subunit dehydrogenase-like uncharacterized protein
MNQITIFGATGYTGRLIVKALLAQGFPPSELCLAGRSSKKLNNLADELHIRPSLLTVDALQPTTLPTLFHDTRLLINCVGPFTDYGEPVILQAAQRGIHYLDITNELGYVHRVHRFDNIARKSGATIIPACGFEVVLADCAVSLLSKKFSGTISDVHITYTLGGSGSSIGTRQSAIRSLATSWLAYRDGEWIAVVPGREVRNAPLPSGKLATISFPSSETVTIPKHTNVQNIGTWMTINPFLRPWARHAVPVFAWLMRRPPSQWILQAVSVFQPPKSGMRSKAPFSIHVEVEQGSVKRTMIIQGKGVYDLTAEIAVYTALHILGSHTEQAGLLAPAEVVNSIMLFDYAHKNWGLQIKELA